MRRRRPRFREALRSFMMAHGSPRRLALAFSLGVFIGFTPLIGLHTVLAIAASIIFRLNKPAILLGTLVLNPLSAPLVLFLSLEIGSLLLYGRPAHLSLSEIRALLHQSDWHVILGQVLQEYLVPYFIGGFVIGALASLPAYWITFRFRHSTGNGAGRAPDQP